MEILILPVNECHLEQCACCEENESEAWSLKQLEEEFNSPFGKLFVALAETSVVGVAVFQFTGFEASLATVTVMPQYRQQGIAKRLLCESMQSLEKEGAKQFFLEVRTQNVPALTLYKSLGFSVVGTRKGFYKNPDDDGYTMSKTY